MASVVISRCFLTLLALLVVAVSAKGHNLRCYQCIKNSTEECGVERLLGCPKVADRCVTHISKHGEILDKGLVIKRECGLGPCGFEDDMVNKGLGMDACDRSKEEYFCVFCCKTDGCNRNSSWRNSITADVMAATILLILYLTSDMLL